MQSKGGVLIFLAILAFPVIAISANHHIFFSVAAAAVTFSSFRHIYSLVMLDGFREHEIDEELEEDLEELIDMDIHILGTGLSVVLNLVVILFLCYCAFFLETVLLKGIAALAISLQVHFIIKKVCAKNSPFDKNRHKPQIFLASVSNLVIVLFTVLNKFSKI